MTTATSVTIQPGAKGADYWALTPTLTAAWLKAQGVSFVIRYIARSKSGKVITPTEVTALHAARIAVVLNYEGSTADLIGGAAGGATNGTWSRNFAAGIGYPEHLPLFVSIDTDVVASNLGSARAYVRAFMAAANPYQPAVYGDTDIAAEVADLGAIFWRANATGWGQVKPGQVVHVQQGRQTTYPAGTIDPNVCLAPFSGWLPHEFHPAPIPPVPMPAPSPSPQGDIMNVLFEIIDGAGVKCAGAMFYAQTDAKGNALQCEWTGDGNPATPTGHKLAAHLVAGLTVRQIGLGSLANMTLLGPVPTGDPQHAWSPADFARVIG